LKTRQKHTPLLQKKTAFTVHHITTVVLQKRLKTERRVKIMVRGDTIPWTLSDDNTMKSEYSIRKNSFITIGNEIDLLKFLFLKNWFGRWVFRFFADFFSL
jgi:hypothetical protein